jgi:outer membrane receptor protein involved in Fe transport
LFDYKFNGEQIYGRAGVWGGGENWGVTLAYGQRTGNDYETGNGTDIPSSYDSRQVDFAFGYDLTPYDHLEFGYLRLDQTGLEFPGQVFDTDFLVTNAYRLRYVSENKEWYDRLVIQGYYNSTSMHGDAQHEGKRLRIPELDLANFTGFTQIDQSSTGSRIAISWGQNRPDNPEPVLTVGQDFRFLNGELNEIDTLFALAIPCGNQVNFPVPRSHEMDLGGFVEYLYPLNPQWTFKAGARGDFVDANIDAIPPNFDCMTFMSIADPDYHTSVYARDFALWAVYGTAEYKPDSNWTFMAGAGHAMRPPTQTELYALGPFLAVLQNGFTTVIGDPALLSEQLWQLDLNARVQYVRFRAGLSGFYSFINDYITYQPSPLVQGGIHLNQVIGSGLTVQFVNTPLATLSGFEFYGEYDVNDWLTPFATVNFVEGRDLTRASHAGTLPAPAQEPLPMIPPLEARVGLRLHEAIKNPTYGFEFYATMDAPQNRVAESLGELPSPGFTIFNLRGYWQVNKAVLLTGGVENLFNRQYREHLDLRTGLGVYEPGINPYLGIACRW